jgi:hypothetical protein
MKIPQLLLLAIVTGVGGFGIAGCDSNDGPAEEMGQALDETGEDVQDAAEDAGNAVEDACEDAKEGVDADDKDC